MKMVLLLFFVTACTGFSSEELRRTAVLIHGCHLGAQKWETIMFGNDHEDGRVSTALKEAFRHPANFVIWGSGASFKEGMIEAEYTFKRAVGSELAFLAKKLNLSLEEVKTFLEERSLLESRAKNTREEVLFALELCLKKGIDSLILISSPTHILRCLQEACKQKEDPRFTGISIYATPSETCYFGSSSSDVVIVEPPHRADRMDFPIHKLFQESLSILLHSPNGELFAENWSRLISEYQSF